MSSLSTSAVESSSSTGNLFQSSPLTHGASGSYLPGLGHSPSLGDGEDGCRTPEAVHTGGSDGADHGEGDGSVRKLLNPFAKEFVPGLSVRAQTPQSAKKPGNSLGRVGQPEKFDIPGRTNLDDGVVTADEAGDHRSSSAVKSGGLSSAFAGNGKGSKSRRGSCTGSRTHLGEVRGSPQSLAGSPAGRRGQMTSANHLLNFHYDPIQRPPPRAPPVPRARQKRPQPYNKELFLQANFRFLVSDVGDYTDNATDPDKMVEWEDVAAVQVLAPQPLQCPICLESPPVSPQITSCGHAFCFPCILRYMMMGEENPRGDYYKKCPLCFAMISCKEMRTVLVQDVKQYEVGDTVTFSLLVRAKGSIMPFERNGSVRSSLSYSRDGYCHGFSKFSLTSDAEPTASKALAELKEWMEKVQAGGSNEELELLPYGLAAAEQVQQRKSAWGDHRATEFLSCSPIARQRIMAQLKAWESGMKVSEGVGSKKLETYDQQGGGESSRVDVLAETELALAELKEKAGWVYENAFSDDEDDAIPKAYGMKGHHIAEAGSADWEDLVTPRESGSIEATCEKEPDHKKESEDKELYYFYQAADGQPVILHPLNMKCLIQHYGGYESLPSSLKVKVLEMEPVTQTEATRKRYRYLSHLPLTTIFQLCEVDLRDQLPTSAFEPFMEEIRGRHNRRQRNRKMDMQQRAEEQRRAALAATNSQRPPSFSEFVPVHSTIPLEDDLAPLVLEDGSVGSCSNPSPSPPAVDERKLFSRVAKLGFASGHDAPNLKTKPADNPAWGSPPLLSVSSIESGSGSSSATPLTFAAMIQAQVATTATEADKGAAGKKGKKAAKVILSTAGGRRY